MKLEKINNDVYLGNYKIIQKIGNGSFSNVFKGEHKQTKKLVAIKAINTQKLDNKILKNINMEIDTMLKLNHENILKLHETIKTESHIYLIMDFCDNSDLYKHIKKNGKFSEDDAKSIFTQIASGLYVLRKNNLIHRDMKPHNILLSLSGNVKIADFGFVASTNDNKLMDTLCGSPIYMAPEILKYNKYDEKVDLWSIGIILFEMLTGKPPFTANNHIQLLRIIETTDFKIADDIIISNECIDLLKSLIVVNPKYRISFQNFFSHPFFDNYDFEKINNIITNDDFVLVNHKDSAEMENIISVQIYLESIYRSASEVGSLGIQFENMNEYSESLCLYIYSLNLLEHAIVVSNKNKIFKKINEQLKKKFEIFLSKAEKIYPMVLENKKNVICAEYIIYHKALEMIKYGCSYEILDDSEKSIYYFVWSMRLLESLTMNETPLNDKDTEIINKFINYVIKIIEFIELKK
jgi:serine/threonine protein kinase